MDGETAFKKEVNVKAIEIIPTQYSVLLCNLRLSSKCIPRLSFGCIRVSESDIPVPILTLSITLTLLVEI